LSIGAAPSVGAVPPVVRVEVRLIGFRPNADVWYNLVFGVLLVLFIIFVPKGILGSILEKLKLRKA